MGDSKLLLFALLGAALSSHAPSRRGSLEDSARDVVWVPRARGHREASGRGGEKVGHDAKVGLHVDIRGASAKNMTLYKNAMTI